MENIRKARKPVGSCLLPSSIPTYSLFLSSIRKLGLVKPSGRNSNFLYFK